MSKQGSVTTETAVATAPQMATTSAEMHPDFAADLAAFQAKFSQETIESFPDAIAALLLKVFGNNMPLRIFWRDPNKQGPAFSLGELRYKLHSDASFATTSNFDPSNFFMVASVELGIPQVEKGSIPLRLELFFGRDVQEQLTALLAANCTTEAVVVPSDGAMIRPFKFKGAEGVTPEHQRSLLQFADGTDWSWPGEDDGKPRIGCAVRPTALILAAQVMRFEPVDISQNQAYVLPPSPTEQGHALYFGPSEDEVEAAGFSNWDPATKQIVLHQQLTSETGAIAKLTYSSELPLPIDVIQKLRDAHPVKRKFTPTPLTYSIADAMAKVRLK